MAAYAAPQRITQAQLTLLRKLIHKSNSLREEVSKEFIVLKPGIGETSRTTFFPYAEDSHEGPKLAYSDLHELRKQGYIDLLGASHGDERCMVTNKALQIFRDTSEALSDSVFSTGDSELNQLLETAVTKYKLYDPKERKDGVEKLWDAWERLKSLEDSHVDKKKESIRLLLEKAAVADTNYFQLLNTEAQALTKIGNDYQIRHSEKRTQAVDDPYQIDYFFERLYALIRLLLRKSGRHR